MKIRPSSKHHRFVGLIFTAIASVTSSSCFAQSAVLSEIYGRGVHAYHAGQYDQSAQWLGMAIDNGFRDPRAYYFRGLATAASGRSDESQADFELGAEIEAQGAFGNSVGRSLSRVQGSTRLQIERIRENARLRFLAINQARSRARYGELGVPAPGADNPALVNPALVNPAMGAPPTAPAGTRNVTPPPASVVDNPFNDDMDQDPTVESRDMLKDAMENATAGETSGPTAGGDAPATSSPFDAPDGSDPFAAPSGGNDPFSGGMENDPFG